MHHLFSPKKKPLTTAQLIDLLEEKKTAEATPFITTFGPLAHDKHGNTLLLHALAWNKLAAAHHLLELDTALSALNLADRWVTCLNTPIILALKINATEIAMHLIRLGAELNHQDYRGFTALHYACLYRNERLIETLLQAGANPSISNAFGHLPKIYYEDDIARTDLAYRFGKKNDQLSPVYDLNKHYFATSAKWLSALRWFLPHLLVNAQLGQHDGINDQSVHAMAHSYLANRQPVFNALHYEAMVSVFIANRPPRNQRTLMNLSLKETEPPTFEDQNYLSPLDLASRGCIHRDGGQIAIEMKEVLLFNAR